VVSFLKKRIIEIFTACAMGFASIIYTGSVYASDNNIASTEITRPQLEGQVNLFKEALDKFGAINPIEAVDLYVLGFKERNGAYQYSILCDKLKQNFIKEMGEPSKSFWVIGVSSPWLQDYRILENKKVNNQTYLIKFRLHWVASGNYNQYEDKALTVVKEGNKWCISDIK
jgi:hypothetical protein